MSARSPRGSLSGASSNEIAEDFEDMLKGLVVNNRDMINGLTLIAKESTEHAQAISRVLEDHIKTAPPPRKLPALYLLDSIVKNVGTPYTVYLGRNLYSTFMNAYTLVDNNTRRAMQGMLKTWMEPVPGSLDQKPVFDLETVRPIRSDIIKHQTKVQEAQNNRQAQTQPHAEYRSTPTPPQYDGNFPPPRSQGPAQPYYGYGVHQPTPLHYNVPSKYSPAPNQQQQYQYPVPEPRPVNDVESVKRDIAALITQRQGHLAANPYNQKLQQETQTLQQLLDFLNSPQSQAQFNPSTLQQIRAQITNLASQVPPQTQPSPLPNVPPQSQWQPPASSSQPPHLVRPPVAYLQPPLTHLQPQAPFLNPAALNGLQALLANGQKPGTPQIRAAAPELQNASHTQLSNIQSQTASTPALDSAGLLAALSKSGLLQNLPAANPTPPAAAPPLPPSQQSTAQLLQSLQGLLPPITSQTGTPTQTHAQLAPPTTGKPRIPLSAAGLKIFRPELVHALYDAQPNQCSTCGRRFLASDEGRAKKARHLDWHFRTNQRMADASIARGAHRDWFVNEMEWISLSDFDFSTATAADTAAAAKREVEVAKGPKDQYVRAPAGVTKNVCSIDFEEMRARYSEELQEWVFTNATVWQGKIVHATCLVELQKGQQQLPMGSSLAVAVGGAGQRQRSATPDSSLGKRKAEGVLVGSGARLRMD